MAQSQTTLGTKSFGDPAPTSSEINNLNTTINDNATDAQSRIVQLEQTDVSAISSYTTSNLPPTTANGTVAFNTDQQVPVYHKDGTWFKMSDDATLIDQNDLDVFLVLGQSNAEGYSFWSNLSAGLRATDRTNNLIYRASLDVDLVTWVAGNWEQINPPTNTCWQLLDCFGPEVGFSDTVKSLVDAGSSSTYQKRVAIAKFAKGGTNLDNDWDPVSNGYMYSGWQSTLSDFQTKLTNEGYTFTIRGVIWFQGEADAADVTDASEYEANLNAFIADVRSDVGNPTLPWVIAKIKFGTPPAYETQVRTAQQNVADADANVTILDAANYTRRDNVHLDAASKYQYGVDCVTAMENAINGV